MVSQCQSKIRRLAIASGSKPTAVQTDKRLMKNVVSNLAQQLQELTTNFRKGQNAYLKSMLQNYSSKYMI
jgi:hypothetical protein